MGHALGVGDSYASGDRDELMYGWLYTGERRLPGADDATGAVAGSITGEEFLGAPIDIGLLPAGKTVTIQWQATIDGQPAGFVSDLNNTGVVSATFGVVLCDTFSNTVTTTVDGLTLGDRVFRDLNTNGVFNAGVDAGIANVSVTLYVDDGDGVFDAGDTAVVGGTDTTDANGFYSFEGLATGSYIVQINEANFNSGAALDGLISVIATSADPNDNVDNDDNGVRVTGQGVVSAAIDLDYDTEPTAGAGNDTNNTLDFGFLSNAPPVLTNLDGDTATFTEDGPAVLLDQGTLATVTDSNNPNFNNGSLTASVSGGTAEDQLSFLEDAIVDIDGSNIVVDLDGSGSNLPTVVGTVTGLGTANLVVTFNANATSGATGTVSALLQHLTYFNSNTLNPPAQRSLTVSVDDGLTGVAAADLIVNITDVNDAPDGTDTTVTGKEDTDYIFTTADFGFGDVDGNSLFAVKITTLPGAGVLTNNGSTVLAGNFVAVADITGGLLKYTPPLDADGAMR